MGVLLHYDCWALRQPASTLYIPCVLIAPCVVFTDNYHYQTMAAQLGHAYFHVANSLDRLPYGGPVDPIYMAQALTQAMEAASARAEPQARRRSQHGPWWRVGA